MNPYVKNLNRVEFLITFACTGRCKHCSEGEHSGSGPYIAAEAAARVVHDAASRYGITSVMTFGGEPLLYPETVYAVHAAAVLCPALSLKTKLALVTVEPVGMVGMVK